MYFKRRSRLIFAFWVTLPVLATAFVSIGFMYVVVTIIKVFIYIDDRVIWLGAILIFLAISRWFMRKYRGRILTALRDVIEPLWSR